MTNRLWKSIARNGRAGPEEVMGHPPPVNATLCENPYFAVRDRGGYFSIEPPAPGVVVLPIVDRCAVAFVRQNRPIIGDLTLELPAGSVDLGETGAKAAARELAEEVGVTMASDALVPMCSISPSTDRIPFLTFAYVAPITAAAFASRRPPAEEIAQVELYTLDEVRALVADGGLYNAQSLGLILQALWAGGHFD